MVLVSVIIPTYNTVKYIFKAIKSVLGQSFKDWELIIVDDASKDKTYEKVMKYIKTNKLGNKIKVIRNKKNLGCYVSMNIGINNAKGKYIARLDADDTMDRNKLKIQASILNKNKKIIGTIAYFKRGKKIKGKNGMATITLMFRKPIIKKIGYFDSVRFGADNEFIHRIYTVYGRKKIKIVRKVLYNAIIRPNSLTTSRKTGFKNNYRSQYWKASVNWHVKNKKKLYMNYPLKKRPFFAPKIMK